MYFNIYTYTIYIYKEQRVFMDDRKIHCLLSAYVSVVAVRLPFVIYVIKLKRSIKVFVAVNTWHGEEISAKIGTTQFVHY